MTERRRDGGFTLVELAVVLLIIAVLIAIATPVFLGMRQRAQDTEAMTTLDHALGAQRAHYAAHERYTTDADALEREIKGAVTWVTDPPAADGRQVQVTVADIGADEDDQDQLVCLVARSRSGRVFTVKDMARGPNGGTWYHRGQVAGCTTDVSGFQRGWTE